MSYRDEVAALNRDCWLIDRGQAEEIAARADAELAKLRALLAEARDCVAESLDAAGCAPNPREPRIQYHRDLLGKIDAAMGRGEGGS